jgi:hypothetical protein
MSEREYRDDDLRDRGWCPVCGTQATVVMVDGSGMCPEHGRVWMEWAPPEPVPKEEEEDE